MKLIRAAAPTRWLLLPLLIAPLVLAGCESRAAAPGGLTMQPDVTATALPRANASPVPIAPVVRSARTLPASVSLTALAELSLGDAGFHGDVWAHAGYAYVGTWGSGTACPATGVKVVDLADPTNPQWVSTLAAIPGTSQEDIVVRRVQTGVFQGDLLAVGIQRCAGAGRAGMALYDVTNPRAPLELGFFDSGSRGVHELDLVQQGGRVLALLAVPDSEVSSRTGDFRIVDVSDPRRPLPVADWGIRAKLNIEPTSGTGCTRRTFDHSARGSADGSRAYLSYWDAGVVVLDISTPETPRLIGRLTNPPEFEGATHSVSESADGRSLFVASEDDVFRSPLGLTMRVVTPEGAREIRGCEASFGRRLDGVGVLTVPVVDAGSGCATAKFPASVRGAIALVTQGGCAINDAATRLYDAGARALIVEVQGDLVALGGGSRAPLPIISVSSPDAAILRATAGSVVTVPSARPWTGVQVWDIQDVAQPRLLTTMRSPGSTTFPPPTAGYYTAHNSEISGDLAFIAWYSDGLRVFDVRDPSAPTEVAAYVPPARRNPQGVIFPDETMVWGVAVADDLLLLSDVNGGLIVLRWRT